MKIEVDLDLCEANGVCQSYCPEIFEVNDKDELEIRQDAIDEGVRDKLELAIKRCPRQALTLVEG